jgi:hypothetical protein
MIEEINIENLIYEIRGKQVMLDSDLAKLYGCKNGTKGINQAVKNNIEKFPERFSCKLTDFESRNLLAKNFDQKNIELRGGKYKNPRVFTEQGIAMLATILKTKNATQVSIRIMDTFVSMRKFINENKDIFKRITKVEYKMLEYDDNFKKIFDALETKKIEKEKIFFNGQIYDAYSLIIDLIKEAENRIIIIDNYIDKSVLDMLVYKKENIDVLLMTSSRYLTHLDIEKFNKQYPNLKIKYSNIFHHRFIIIDNTLYHVGASFKDLGKKCFGINKIEDKEYLNKIIEIINQ